MLITELLPTERKWQNQRSEGRKNTHFGRIVALADVYDALSCKRVYKEPWAEDKVLEEIKSQRGKKFDPGVVDAFFEILPSIKAIKERFPDVEETA